jgi:hypothetical protein
VALVYPERSEGPQHEALKIREALAAEVPPLPFVAPASRRLF